MSRMYRYSLPVEQTKWKFNSMAETWLLGMRPFPCGIVQPYATIRAKSGR